MLRQYSSAVVSGLRIFLARPPLPLSTTSLPPSLHRLSLPLSVHAIGQPWTDPKYHVIPIVWGYFCKPTICANGLITIEIDSSTTVIKRKLGLWGGRTDRDRSWSLESWRWKGWLKMEPVQRRIPETEREGEEEGERSVTYLHVIGRESDSITRSNRRSFPLKCAFFFISVTLIFYLSPPALPRFVTLAEYSYTIGRNRISRRVISPWINVIHEKGGGISALASIQINLFTHTCAYICTRCAIIIVETIRGMNGRVYLSLCLSQRSRIGSLCVTECAFKPGALFIRGCRDLEGQIRFNLFLRFSPAPTPSFLFVPCSEPTRFIVWNTRLQKKKEKKRKAGVVS